VGDLTAGIEQAPLAGAGQMLLRGSKVPTRRRHRLRRVGTRDHAAIVSGLLSGKFAFSPKVRMGCALRSPPWLLELRAAIGLAQLPSGAGLLREVVSTMEA
jgi:hypothetical protein